MKEKPKNKAWRLKHCQNPLLIAQFTDKQLFYVYEFCNRKAKELLATYPVADQEIVAGHVFHKWLLCLNAKNPEDPAIELPPGRKPLPHSLYYCYNLTRATASYRAKKIPRHEEFNDEEFLSEETYFEFLKDHFSE
jgi:hypothetical protein